MSARKVKMQYRIKQDNEAEDSLLKPCFQVTPDVEFKEVPTTGEEYLVSVMNERKNYAVVSQCTKDVSKFAKYQNKFIVERPLAEVDERIKPTLEWQNIQVADFSEVRMRVSRHKLKYPQKIGSLDRQPSVLSHWRKLFEGSEPAMSCVLGMKSALVDTGIENVTELLQDIKPGDTISNKLGQWIYAFLVCVRHPLIDETICAIRGLCRQCIDIRSHLNPDDEDIAAKVAPLNIFICLVGRYFGQFDLADS